MFRSDKRQHSGPEARFEVAIPTEVPFWGGGRLMIFYFSYPCDEIGVSQKDSSRHAITNMMPNAAFPPKRMILVAPRSQQPFTFSHRSKTKLLSQPYKNDIDPNVKTTPMALNRSTKLAFNGEADGDEMRKKMNPPVDVCLICDTSKKKDANGC